MREGLYTCVCICMCVSAGALAPRGLYKIIYFWAADCRMFFGRAVAAREAERAYITRAHGYKSSALARKSIRYIYPAAL